jgi:hypothetical protein
MNIQDYIIILFSIITIVLIIKQSQYEFMESLNDTLKTKDILTVPDIIIDPLFEDIIFYQNDKIIDYPTYNLGKLGLHKCFELCDGSCVEFGMTGNCLCFPNIK